MIHVGEVACILLCSESYFRRVEKSGKISKAKLDINGRRVYDDKDVEYSQNLLSPTRDDFPDVKNQMSGNKSSRCQHHPNNGRSCK